MSSGHRRDFFKNVKDHSQIKLTAFERYLTPWTAKVGSRLRNGRVWIVDGFAGAGAYESGELGSSGLALSFASKVNSESRSYRVACFFAETSQTAITRLRRLTSRHPEVEAPIWTSDFWTGIDSVVDFVDGEPVFVFIDPYGLKDLKFDRLVELCRRLKNVDLMVNFASTAAVRLLKERPEIIDEAVGGPGWELATLTATFCQRLREACDFLPPAVLPVAAEIGGLKYELVMAARHPAAYELWNDEIASDDKSVLDSEDDDAKQRLLSDAKSILREAVSRRKAFARDRLVSELCVSHCGEVHSRALRKAVEELLNSGEWSAGPGKVATRLMRRSAP